MKFRKKPVEVEAEQYFVGKKPVLKGVNITYPEIIFSRDGRLFYVTHTDALNWMSVEPVNGKYESYPFAFYEVNTGIRKPIEDDLKLVLQYLTAYELAKPEEHAWVTTIHGNSVTLTDGDWVLPEPDGEHFYPCKSHIFSETYEPID